MKFFRRLYTLYGLIIFFLLFIIFFFLLLIPIIFPKKFRLVGRFNRWWAKLMLILIGIPFQVCYKSGLNPKKQYIFCPNHCSYMDIATVALNKHDTVFVGKNDMENIPFFGFMYSKLHITVDRAKLKSRYITLVKSLKAIDQGKSLVIFPEGGIVTKHPPVMGEFKDGAFRAAIEKQIPVVPVTIPYNWIILPAEQFLLRWRPMKIIFHEPLDPAGYTLKELDTFKSKVKSIIENELQNYFKKA